MLTGASQKVGLQCQSLLNGILFDSERAAGATATMVMTGGGGKGARRCHSRGNKMEGEVFLF